MFILFEHSVDNLVFDVRKWDSLCHLDFLGNASLDVFPIVSRTLNYKCVVILNFYWSGISINLFHALDSINSDEITMFEAVFELLIYCDFSLILVCYIVDQKDREVLTCVHHFEGIAEVSEHIAIESHLACKNNTTVVDIVLSEHRVYPNNSIDVINVAENEQIEFLCVFRLEFLVELLNQRLFVDFFTDLNETVHSECLANLIWWIVECIMAISNLNNLLVEYCYCFWIEQHEICCEVGTNL